VTVNLEEFLYFLQSTTVSWIFNQSDLQWSIKMSHFALSVATVILIVGSGLCSIESAAAQQQPPCTTQSECAAREDQRDTAARRDEYARNVKSQTDAHAAAIQARNEASTRVSGNRQAKVQAILQRRREVYAHVRN
jgi:hypothetical protein